VVTFGETLVDRFRDQTVLGGAPFNVTCHLAGLGIHPVLLTRVGKDAEGARLLEALHVRGIDTHGVQRDPVLPTGQVTVSENGHGHVFDILPDQAYDHIHARTARMVAMAAHPALVYFGTLSQRGDSRRALRELLGAVTARGFLDVNLRDPWVDTDVLRWSLQRASVVKLNDAELERVAALFRLDADKPEILADLLLDGFELERVIVTRGEAGAWTLDRGGLMHATQSDRVPRLIDTVGAGDAFAAVFMAGLLKRWPVPETLSRADRFARAVCGIRGAVPDSDDFYHPFRRDWSLYSEVARA
jgi:fructokinase